MSAPLVYIDPRGSGGDGWSPRLAAVGEAFAGRQPGLTEEERTRLVVEAQDILATAQPPSERGSKTTLVVGRVQSGKTLSFEMLTALARDNGFGVVIIVAGISKFLMRQTRNRFSQDLRLEDVTSGAYENWLLVTSSQMLNGDHLDLPVVLEEWRQRREDSESPQTAVIITLKHFAHIDEVIGALPHGFSVPTLIIDDEADQASLNANVNRANRIPTTTFRAIARLRQKLACHTYVQYTATPQANLLLAAVDTLAPDAVRMITPGGGYTGNEDFISADPAVICRIPDEDAAVFSPSGGMTEPPGSLTKAVDVFVAAAALGWHYARVDAAGGPSPAQISMLVHPERFVSEHSKAAKWVRARLQALRGLDDRDLASTLEVALTELRRTAKRPDVPAACDELVADIRKTLRMTGVLILNRADDGYSADAGEDIPWESKYAWIVVGGQMIDRGLTIPGLAITYIPRSSGVNVDTVQQRARWLGYKRSYFDRCRVWMTDSSKGFFKDYADHEAEMHREVERIVETGVHLKTWRRQFLLDPSLRPTRRNVISRGLQRHSLEAWQPFLSLGAGDPPDGGMLASFTGLEDYVRGLQGFEGQSDHGHAWTDCTLKQAFDALDLYPVYDAEGADLKALLLGHLARRIEREGSDLDVARIYLMDNLDVVNPRERGVKEDPDGTEPVEIKSLLQGRNRSYPGDREMRRWSGQDPQLTLQFHRVLPTRDKRGGPALWPRGLTTVVLATFIPPGTDPGWVIEAL